MYTPNTVLYLLNTPLSMGEAHQLTFSSVSAQSSYFLGCAVHSYINSNSFTFQRKDNYIRVPANVETLYNCNYVMYKNTQFSSKYFYAYITKLEYVNENVTNVYIKTDVWQTWQFDLTFNKSFIERQHLAADEYNTLADIPSTGELYTVNETTMPLKGAYIILLNSPVNQDDVTTLSAGMMPQIGNYSMPCIMLLCDSNYNMSRIISAISNKGRADRIQACYYAPHVCDTSYISTESMDKGDLSGINDIDVKYVTFVDKDDIATDFEVDLVNTVNFKKELCYPYAKIEVADKITGKTIVLDISKFSNPLKPSFKIYGSLSEKPEYRVVPLNYNGELRAVEHTLVISPNTEMPILNNTYAKYIKDNGTANFLNGVMSLSGAVASAGMGNYAGVAGGFTDVARLLNSDSVQHSQPNQLTGLCGDAGDYINYIGSLYFRIKIMDDKHLDVARNFWKYYGYPVRKIATPNLTSNFKGDSFNFIKMIEPNINGGNVLQDDMKEIEDMFSKGITLWHNSATFKQY